MNAASYASDILQDNRESTHPMILLLTALAFDIRTTEKAPPEAVPAAIRKLLDSTTIEIRDGDALQSTIWLRKGIPAKATEEQVKNGLSYRELVETSVVGIVTFEKKWTDFRKQEIPAGTYTLRLVFQPDTGDYKETAPHTEFLMISPIADDSNPDEVEVMQLLERSKKATGGDHPAVMLLFPGKLDGDKPKLESKERGIQVIHVKRSVDVNGKLTSITFGLTIAGTSEKR